MRLFVFFLVWFFVVEFFGLEFGLELVEFYFFEVFVLVFFIGFFRFERRWKKGVVFCFFLVVIDGGKGFWMLCWFGELLRW